MGLKCDGQFPANAVCDRYLLVADLRGEELEVERHRVHGYPAEQLAGRRLVEPVQRVSVSRCLLSNKSILIIAY